MSLHARATRPFRGKEHLSRVSRSAPRQHATANVLPASLGLLAIRLLDWAAEAGGGGLIYVAATNRRAERLASILRGLAPELEVLLFPPWDCLPYDRSSPSREAMGRRMATLRRVCHPKACSCPPHRAGRADPTSSAAFRRHRGRPATAGRGRVGCSGTQWRAPASGIPG